MSSAIYYLRRRRAIELGLIDDTTGDPNAWLPFPVEVELVLRSVEGVFSFLGAYLREMDASADAIAARQSACLADSNTQAGLHADGHAAPVTNPAPGSPEDETALMNRVAGDRTRLYWVDCAPLFDVEEGQVASPLVTAILDGQRYSVLSDRNDPTHRNSMRILALLQQLVNLHKRSTDRPTTPSVRILN